MFNQELSLHCIRTKDKPVEYEPETQDLLCYTVDGVHVFKFKNSTVSETLFIAPVEIPLHMIFDNATSRTSLNSAYRPSLVSQMKLTLLALSFSFLVSVECSTMLGLGSIFCVPARVHHSLDALA